MNKRQSKKKFRKAVEVFPSGRKTKAGTFKKKRDKHTSLMLYKMGYTPLIRQKGSDYFENL